MTPLLLPQGWPNPKLIGNSIVKLNKLNSKTQHQSEYQNSISKLNIKTQ
jgi:hypothetical protein